MLHRLAPQRSSTPRGVSNSAASRSQAQRSVGLQRAQASRPSYGFLAQTQQRFIAINKVTLMGHVGGPPQLKAFEGGAQVVSFTLAVTETYKDKRTDSKVDKTEWFRVSVWNPFQQDLVQKYVTKGSRLYLEGSLRTRKWKDAVGTEKTSVEVQLKGPKAELILIPSSKKDGGAAAAGGGLPDNETMFGDSDEPVRTTEGNQHVNYPDFPGEDPHGEPHLPSPGGRGGFPNNF